MAVAGEHEGDVPPDRRARARGRPAHGRARRHERDDRLVLLPGVRLPERVRRDPRQGPRRLLLAPADRRRLDLQAALLPGHERPHHALLHPRRRGGGAGLHADRGAARHAPPPAAAARRRRARHDGVRARGPAALRLRARGARDRAAPARRAVPRAVADARARGRDREVDGRRRAAGSSATSRACRRRFAVEAGAVAVVRPRARRRRPHLPAVLRARDGDGVRGDRRLLARAGWSARATAGAGARWSTAPR